MSTSTTVFSIYLALLIGYAILFVATSFKIFGPKIRKKKPKLTLHRGGKYDKDAKF